MKRYLLPLVLAMYTITLLAAGVAEVRAQAPSAPKAPAAAGKPDKGLTVEEAVRRLEAADMFAIGGVGFAARKTPAGEAYDFLLTHAKGRETFVRLLKASRWVTRMYALAGLSAVAPEEAAKVYPTYENSKVMVKTAHGCMISSETVGAIVQQAKKGNFRLRQEPKEPDSAGKPTINKRA
jgi:hypothetical protein